ncbi:MAG: HD domain-containing protein [Psychromonas sp.]
MLEKALQFSELHHKGQVDKAGVDYFSGHILAVVANAKKLTNEEVVHVASALHDVVEDTEVSIEEVARLFGEEVAEIVKLVSKVEGVPKSEYFRAIKGNPKARLVKVADMTHNSDLSRLAVVHEADLLRTAQYKKWMEYLA